MAGSWATAVEWRKGYLNNAYARPVGRVSEFTADASDGGIPEETVSGVSGLLTGIDVEFDGTTAPNALVVAIKTIGGITLVTSGSLTTSARIEVSPPIDVCGGYKITPTTNTTNSAKAKIILLFR